jgi:hypothetical protein
MKTKNLVVPALLAALAVGAWPHAAHAWNKPGHMVVAAIAYRELQRTNNQAVIDKVIAGLKKHPDYDRRFASKLSSVRPEDQDLYLFMLAARWADDIKDHQPADDDKKAHFIDTPFVPPGLTGVAIAPPDNDNIVSKFKNQSDIIRNGGGDAAKAKALTWLLHLAGDSHQPLHAVTMFTHDFTPPQGDRGGNEVFVKVEENSHTINLHAYWDGAILGSDHFQSVRNRALGLIGRPDMRRNTFPQLSSGTVDQWVAESFEMAKTVAYRNGEIEGSGDSHDGQLLPSDYPSTAKGVAERQVVLAGYRLADLLRDLAPSL